MCSLHTHIMCDEVRMVVHRLLLHVYRSSLLCDDHSSVDTSDGVRVRKTFPAPNHENTLFRGRNSNGTHVAAIESGERIHVDEVYEITYVESTRREWSGDDKILEEWRVRMTKPHSPPFDVLAILKPCSINELLSTFALRRHVESLPDVCHCFPIPLMTADDRRRIAIHGKIRDFRKAPDDVMLKGELMDFAKLCLDDEIVQHVVSFDSLVSFRMADHLSKWVRTEDTRAFTSVTPPGWINLTSPSDFKHETLRKLFRSEKLRQSCLEQLGRGVAIMGIVVQHNDWYVRNVPICTPESEDLEIVRVGIVDFDNSSVHTKSEWEELIRSKQHRLTLAKSLVKSILDDINTWMSEHSEPIDWDETDEKWYGDAIREAVKHTPLKYPLADIPYEWGPLVGDDTRQTEEGHGSTGTGTGTSPGTGGDSACHAHLLRSCGPI